MAIKARLTDEDQDTWSKDVNDLDAAYLERMKNDGIDPMLLEQFMILSIEMDKETSKD